MKQQTANSKQQTANSKRWYAFLIITNIITIICLGYISLHDKVPQRFLNKIGIINMDIQPKNYINYRIQALHSLGSEEEGFDIIMLGDSITEGGNWAELLKGYDVANYGIGGDTTTGILYRLSDVYMARPSKVFLMVGINDISSYLTNTWNKNNIETIFENYKKIVNDLREHNIEVIIQSTLNTSQKSFQMETERNNDVDKLNELLKIYCEEGNIKFLDINQSLSKAGILIEKYTGDGLHLNYEGYKIWREKIISVL